ncbi:MAG: hypothetical protein Salg2KO_04510 [Salibacteraceae bacterium]
MKHSKTLSILAGLFLVGCSSTKFPATNDEKQSYLEKQDEQIETPREHDIDRKTGLGGGK